MISVQQAEQLLQSASFVFPARECPLDAALDKVLRENISADRDYPPADNAAMDGFALSFREWKEGTRTFVLSGTQPAGCVGQRLKSKESCLEIMTGAVVPEGCDCVVPLEDVERHADRIFLPEKSVLTERQFIRAQAQYCRQGQVLLSPGRQLSGQDLLVAAETGKTKILVTDFPAAAVVTSGDELVPFDQPVAAHQSRQSNRFGITAALQRQGFSRIDHFHVIDQKDRVTELFARLVNEYPVVISSGAVSRGRYDFIPQVLADLGVQIVFHRVKQRPGKPLLFGKTPSGGVVFGLPGNPVSTLVCLSRYVLPFLAACSGQSDRELGYAVLAEDVSLGNDLTLFVPVIILAGKDGVRHAQPVSYAGSGDFTVLAKCQGFVELCPEHGVYGKGEAVRFFSFAGKS